MDGSALRIAVIAGVLGVPACAYRPGSFRAPVVGTELRGERATAGCLDVAVLARAPTPTGQVVEVSFANRCDHPTVIDFPALRSTGRDVDGIEHSLAIFDPAGELRPLAVEARIIGREVIELQAVSGTRVALTGACLDVAALARAEQDGARWLCVGAPSAAPIDPNSEVTP